MNGEKIPDADTRPVKTHYRVQGMKNIAAQSADNVIPGSSITSTLKVYGVHRTGHIWKMQSNGIFIY